jgi:NAD(P)-dependent dehydrogenase (short-subunit alcohol dehydrogenase family)
MARTVLITGRSRGIGAATAGGCEAVTGSHQLLFSQKQGGRTGPALKKQGLSGEIFRADVFQPGEVLRMVERRPQGSLARSMFW